MFELNCHFHVHVTENQKKIGPSSGKRFPELIRLAVYQHLAKFSFAELRKIDEVHVNDIHHKKGRYSGLATFH